MSDPNRKECSYSGKPNNSDLTSQQAAIDTLDAAIKHYDEIAEECRKKANIEQNDYMDMRDGAYEARQLALWLNELKHLREKIEQLTIEPERKTGVWLENGDDPESIKTDGYCGYCSDCKEMSEYLTAYCGNCGADMRGTWNEKCR